MYLCGTLGSLGCMVNKYMVLMD